MLKSHKMFLLDYFSGLATNVSVQLLVASMGSINTENMVSATDLKCNAQSGSRNSH